MKVFHKNVYERLNIPTNLFIYMLYYIFIKTLVKRATFCEKNFPNTKIAIPHDFNKCSQRINSTQL